jgi:hypothetical protein
VSNVNLNQPPKNIITDLLNTVSPTILHLADLDYDMPIDIFGNSNNRNTLLTVYPSNFSKHKRDFTFYYNRLPANLLTNNTDKVSVKKATNTFEFIDVINKLYNLQVQHEEIYYEELPELNKDTFTNVNIKFRPESYIWIGDFTFKIKDFLICTPLPHAYLQVIEFQMNSLCKNFNILLRAPIKIH